MLEEHVDLGRFDDPVAVEVADQTGVLEVNRDTKALKRKLQIVLVDVTIAVEVEIETAERAHELDQRVLLLFGQCFVAKTGVVAFLAMRGHRVIDRTLEAEDSDEDPVPRVAAVHHDLPIPEPPERGRAHLMRVKAHVDAADPIGLAVRVDVPLGIDLDQVVQQEVRVRLDRHTAQCRLERRVIRSGVFRHVAACASDRREDRFAGEIRTWRLRWGGHEALEVDDLVQEGVGRADFRFRACVAARGVAVAGRQVIRLIFRFDEPVGEPKFIPCGVRTETEDARKLRLPAEAADTFDSRFLECIGAVCTATDGASVVRLVGEDVGIKDRLHQAEAHCSDRPAIDRDVRDRKHRAVFEGLAFGDLFLRASRQCTSLADGPAEIGHRVESGRGIEHAELLDGIDAVTTIDAMAGETASCIEDRSVALARGDLAGIGNPTRVEPFELFHRQPGQGITRARLERPVVSGGIRVRGPAENECD